MQREFVPFVKAVELMIGHCKGIVQDKKISLTVKNLIPECRTRRFYSFFDTYKIDQAFRNIISNSSKFTPAGGSIAVTLSLEGDEVAIAPATASLAVHPVGCDQSIGKFIVRIKDNGAGMTAENISKLFGRFVQFDANTLHGTPRTK